MRNPKLLMVNHYALLPDEPGGHRHFDLAKALSGHGWDTVVLACSSHHYAPTSGRSRHSEPGVDFIRLPSTQYRGNGIGRLVNMLVFSFRVVAWGTRRQGASKPDVVVGSSAHLPAAFAAYLVAKARRASFIFEVRDLWPDYLIELGQLRRSGPVAIVMRLLEKFLYRRAWGVIVLAPHAESHVVGLGGPADRILHLPHGIAHLPAFEPAPELKHFVIRYVGAHGVANGLQVLIDAAARLQSIAPQVRIETFGDGPEREALEMEARARRLTNIRFCGIVGGEAVPAILREAGALVISLPPLDIYRRIGFSFNKVPDYLAAGRPIILAGDARGAFVEKFACGFVVPPMDGERLARAMMEVAKMAPSKRLELGARAYDAARQLQVPSLADQLNQFLRSAVGERGNRTWRWVRALARSPHRRSGRSVDEIHPK